LIHATIQLANPSRPELQGLQVRALADAWIAAAGRG
jgi:hypothetical protein